MDPFDLQRFLAAQDPIYPQVRAELAAGAKCTHWMWFIFPQIAGLGHSPTARRYAITGREEAAAYLAHTILGTRLLECTTLVNAVPAKSARDIFGTPDDLKFRSSMTLFARIATDHAVFSEALARYFQGVPDQATLDRL